MKTLKNQALIAFRQELQQIWERNRYLGRAEILTKIRKSLYNHDKAKAQDLDNQTLVATELLQATITENLRLLIDSVGTSAQLVHFEHFTPQYFEG